MQNQRTSVLMSEYRPQLAVVVYQSGTERDDYYLESHTITAEGKPLLQETLQEMVDVFFDERKNTVNVRGLIPDNLLSFDLLPGGHYKMVWYRPAEIRVMHFAKQLQLPTAKTWVPAMVYVVNRK